MALITCHKCGKPVSDRAEKCPHCGCNPKDCGGVEKLNDAAPKEVSNSTPTIKTEKSWLNGDYPWQHKANYPKTIIER